MPPVVFDEALELLDPFLHWVSVVALSLRTHVHLGVALSNSGETGHFNFVAKTTALLLKL